jgi:molybdopterin synthase sulfur carrier subunit
MASDTPLAVLYFAWVAERLGRREDTIPADCRTGTVAALLAHMCNERPEDAAALGDPSRLRAALDQRFVPLDTIIGNAQELAIFPPVTGG